MSRNVVGFLFTLCFLFASCNSKPKVIEPKSVSNESQAAVEDPSSEMHEVIVEDFLQATRYTYLNVREGDKGNDTFWIAVPRSEVEKGETYYYQEGVRMHNFESKEHNRIFETLYLVGGISKSPVPGGYAGAQNEIDMHGGQSQPMPQEIEPIEGGIKLTDLFADPSQYSEKTIMIKGQCVKVNRNIMGKNWVHIQDGSKNEANGSLDLTVTTQEEIALGEVVVLQGKIGLNRDFGSGYRYDVIMEEATLK